MAFTVCRTRSSRRRTGWLRRRATGRRWRASRGDSQLVQVGRPELLAVPRLVANVRSRLYAPALRRAHVDVLVTPVARDAAGAIHAELHEVDAAGSAVRRRGDLVVQHQMAPIRPDELRFAAAAAAADERGESIAPLSEDAAAGGKPCVGVAVDEYAVGRKNVRIVVAVFRTRVDAVCVAVDELRNLLIVERRQRAGLRGGTTLLAE